jgi:Effector-associated domain 7
MSDSNKRDNLIALRETMEARLDETEVKILCHDIGIDYNDLDDTNKRTSIISLIMYCERRNRLSLLMSMLARLRPDTEWYKKGESSNTTLYTDMVHELIEDMHSSRLNLLFFESGINIARNINNKHLHDFCTKEQLGYDQSVPQHRLVTWYETPSKVDTTGMDWNDVVQFMEDKIRLGDRKITRNGEYITEPIGILLSRTAKYIDWNAGRDFFEIPFVRHQYKPKDPIKVAMYQIRSEFLRILISCLADLQKHT